MGKRKCANLVNRTYIAESTTDPQQHLIELNADAPAVPGSDGRKRSEDFRSETANTDNKAGCSQHYPNCHSTATSSPLGRLAKSEQMKSSSVKNEGCGGSRATTNTRRLVSKGSISNPRSQVKPPAKTPCLVFLDLDNTLIPTTWMMAQWRAPYSNEPPYLTTIDIEKDRTRRINDALVVSGLFDKLDMLFHELKYSLGVDMISIVTNAGSKTVEWFYLSYCIPQLKTLITKHNITIQSTERWVKELGPPPDATHEDAFREFYTDVKYHEFDQVLQTFVPDLNADPVPLDLSSPSPLSSPCNTHSDDGGYQHREEDHNALERDASCTTTCSELEDVPNIETHHAESPKAGGFNSQSVTPSTSASVASLSSRSETDAHSRFWRRDCDTDRETRTDRSVQGDDDRSEEATVLHGSGTIPDPYAQIGSSNPPERESGQQKEARNNIEGVHYDTLSNRSTDKNVKVSSPSSKGRRHGRRCEKDDQKRADESSNRGRRTSGRNAPAQGAGTSTPTFSAGDVMKKRSSSINSDTVNTGRSHRKFRGIDVISVGDQMCEITAACRLTKEYPNHVRFTKLLIICDGLDPCVEVQTPSSFVVQVEWLRLHLLQLLRNNTETLDRSGERAQWKMSTDRNNFLFAVSQPHRFVGPYPQLPAMFGEEQSPATPTALSDGGAAESSSSETISMTTECTAVGTNVSIASISTTVTHTDSNHRTQEVHTSRYSKTYTSTSALPVHSESTQQLHHTEDDEYEPPDADEETSTSQLESVSVSMQVERRTVESNHSPAGHGPKGAATAAATTALTSGPGVVHVADMFKSNLIPTDRSNIDEQDRCTGKEAAEKDITRPRVQDELMQQGGETSAVPSATDNKKLPSRSSAPPATAAELGLHSPQSQQRCIDDPKRLGLHPVVVPVPKPDSPPSSCGSCSKSVVDVTVHELELELEVVDGNDGNTVRSGDNLCTSTLVDSTSVTVTDSTMTTILSSAGSQLSKDRDVSGAGEADVDYCLSGEKELIAGVAWSDVDHGKGHLLPDDSSASSSTL